jgi:hypothetical protein
VWLSGPVAAALSDSALRRAIAKTDLRVRFFLAYPACTL